MAAMSLALHEGTLKEGKVEAKRSTCNAPGDPPAHVSHTYCYAEVSYSVLSPREESDENSRRENRNPEL